MEECVKHAEAAINCLRNKKLISQIDEYYLGFAYFLNGSNELSSHYFNKSFENVWYDDFSW